MAQTILETEVLTLDFNGDSIPGSEPKYPDLDQNAWKVIAEAHAKAWFERDKLTKGDRGRQLDPFARFADRFFNPDRMSLQTYRRMMKDSQIAGAFQVIFNITPAKGWKIIKGKEEHQKFLVDMFDLLNMNVVFKEALSSIWLGFHVMEKVFDQDDEGVWFIKRYKSLPPDTVTFEIKETGEVTAVVQDASFSIGIDKAIRFLPKKVNVITMDSGLSDQFGNPYGQSILRAAYKDWFAKTHLVRYQNRYLELVAGGLLVGNAGFSDPDAMHKKLVQAKSSSTLVIKHDQTIELHRPTSAGSPFMESVHYHDLQVSKVLLVPNLLLGHESQDTGSRALSQTYFDLFRIARIRPLQQMLSFWVDADIRQIIRTNFGVQEEYPRFTFKQWTQQELDQLASYHFKLASAGITGTNDLEWIREDIDIPDIPPGGIGEPLMPSQRQQADDSRDPGAPASRENRRGTDGSTPDRENAPSDQ